MDCLQQAAVSEHAKFLAYNAHKVLSVAYKPKNLRYPVTKYYRYTCMDAQRLFSVDDRGINFSSIQKEEPDIMICLPFNTSYVPRLNVISLKEERT